MKPAEILFRVALRRAAGVLALSFMAALTGCGGPMDGNDADALYELTGRWHDNRYDFAFEITQEGEGYIAKTKTQYTVSVSRGFVRFRDRNDYVIGSFYYSIKIDELSITLGTGDFRNMESLSPFIKSGSKPSGGAVPVEFIGKWQAKTNPPSTPNFEITKSGSISISGSAASYTARISGNTVAVLEGSILKGTFQYAFTDDEMIVTKGTDMCAGLEFYSPFVKK
jgi:hypothetical protein